MIGRSKIVAFLTALVVTGVACVGAEAAPSRPTRTDLARAYLRLERALQAYPATSDERAMINRAFDDASLAFFRSDLGAALRQIDTLTLERVTSDIHGRAVQSTLAVRITTTPRWMVRGTTANARVRIEPLYAPDIDLAIPHTIKLRVIDPDGRVVVESNQEVPRNGVREIAMTDLVTDHGSMHLLGRYTFQVNVAHERWLDVGGFCLVDEPAKDFADRVATQLGMIEPHPSIDAAVATCRSRLGLLRPSSASFSSARAMLDPATLMGEVDAEAQAISGGVDPYLRRPGDLWREVTFAGTSVPVRVYAPKRCIDGSPMPLVIALHGAGGDESMFTFAYGAGELIRLADAHNFIVAAPLTYTVAARADAFDALIQEMMRCYAIDAHRVYVLGHSLGAAVAASLACTHEHVLAAACGIAGAPVACGSADTAPSMCIAAELDPLMSSDSARALAEQAAAGGQVIHFRLMPGEGHTLVVGPALPSAIEWLLSQVRRDAASSP